MAPQTAARALLNVLILFVIQFIGITACLLLLALLFRLDTMSLWRQWSLPEPVASIYGVCFFVLAFLNVRLCHRYLNRQEAPLRSLGLLPADGVNLAHGWLLGFLMLVVLQAVELAGGWLSWAPVLPEGKLAQLLLGNILLGFAVGFLEELIFRGYILQTLLTGLPRWVAVVVSSSIYAVLHFIRPHLSLGEMVVPLLGLILVGMVLCQAYIMSGSLWMSIGLHASWVFLINTANRCRLWEARPEYNWLTGGTYPVTGLLGAIMLAILWGALVEVTRRRVEREKGT